MKSSIFALTSALAVAAPAYAQDAAPDTDSPLETIIVIGERAEEAPLQSALEPTRTGRLSTLPDLFRSQAGVIVEPIFGGVDHPRFAIRGSGLQRGTQPAGRGIELRLDGLPMTYADTSYDFVEWIDPLTFGSVRVLRGGRGALEGGAALGGVVDFQGQHPDAPLEFLARGEVSGFGGRRGQASIGGRSGESSGYFSGTWFKQKGFRDFNQQEAWRIYANGDARLSDAVSVRGGFLWSDSNLQLPGPQTLAQINEGARVAQPANVAGNWRRSAERVRGTVGTTIGGGNTKLTLDAGLMQTDVSFTRRDVQVEDNEDWSFAGTLRQSFADDQAHAALQVHYQHGRRNQKLYLNGGGTMPSFTGEAGLKWADNDFTATRLTVTGKFDVRIAPDIRFDAAAGVNRHGRKIEDNFATRMARPAATLDRDYSGFTGLGLITWDAAPNVATFVSLSRNIEPPTWDTLFINVAGMGSGASLVDGPNPRRPVIVNLETTRDTTLEAGIKGHSGPLDFDITLYRSWLRNEIVSTSDFVSQVVSSVGNADRTQRWGVEASTSLALGSPGLQNGDTIKASANWTWTDARFVNDSVFGDNRLPILPPHLIEIGFAYGAPSGFFADALISIVPQGGWADYANTLRDDGRTVLGARAGWSNGNVMIFAEGRNLTDTRYASSVIAAQNNLGGIDRSTFAPGEGRSFTLGAELRF